MGVTTAYVVYECPACGERFVDERRCPSCGEIVLADDLAEG